MFPRRQQASFSLQIIILYVLHFLCKVGVVTSVCPERGEDVVTSNLRDVVIGRCVEWQTNIHPDLICGDGMKNCTLLWQKFSSGFSYQSLCHVSTDAFRDFISAADHEIPHNKQLFYEDTYDLVRRYTHEGKRMYTIENTLPGHIADGLHFCASNTTSDGIARDTPCPSYVPTPECPMSAESAFWSVASENFASKARGDAHVLFNASASPIFRNTSYFAQNEMVNLNPNLVTTFHVWIINDNPSLTRSPCSDASIAQLETYLTNKGIKVVCEENPRDLLLQHCSDQSSFPAACRHVIPTSRASVTCQLTSHVLTFVCLFVLGIQYTVRRL